MGWREDFFPGASPLDNGSEGKKGPCSREMGKSVYIAGVRAFFFAIEEEVEGGNVGW